MYELTLGIILTSAVSGAIFGIKKAQKEVEKFQKVTAEGQRQIKALQEKASSSFREAGLTAVGAGMAIKRLVAPAIEFESAMADVKKVVDFDTPQQFEQMQKDILGLTRTLPLAGEELAEIAASGGQLGVARQDIASFTTTIAKMSTAFDMGAGESGDAMAKLANVYKIPIKEIDKLGDAINHLSDSTPAKARDILNTLGRVGGLAKQFGLTEIQAASLSGAFIALGKTPETAATAIKSMMITLSTADKAGGKVAESIGLLGLSTKELKANIAKDGESAIVDILHRVNQIPKEFQTGILVDIFGKQFAGDVATLAGGIDTYKDSIELLNKTDAGGNLEYLGSMGREFDTRAKTTENNIQLLKNSLTEISVVLGNSLMPILNDVVNEIKPVITDIADFAKNNPALVSGLLKTVFALTSLRVAFLTAKGFKFLGLAKKIVDPKSISFLGRFFNLTKSIFGFFISNIPKLAGLAKIAFSSVRVGILSLGRAAMANPIGLAIGAIAGGAYLVYKYWQPIKGFFSNLWNGITSIFTSAINGISSITKNIGSFLMDGLIGGIVEKITAVKDTVVNVASAIGGWFKSVLGISSPSKVFTGYGKNITEGLSLGILSGEEAPKQNIKKLADSINGTDFKAIKPLNLNDPLQPKGNNLANTKIAGGNNQSITINFNPTINAPNGNSTDIKQALNMSLIEFERLFNRMIQSKKREAF